VTYSIKGKLTCCSTNMIYAIFCQQCPSALCIGQTEQSLRKRINGHKFDIRNQEICLNPFQFTWTLLEGLEGHCFETESLQIKNTKGNC
ncbi:hypothetical protein JRQ81_019434, partial [Phrynocephalus forsythii]